MPTRRQGARRSSCLKACLAYLKSGDTLVVWKLDRLGRSLPHLLSIITDFRKRGVAFRSLRLRSKLDYSDVAFALLPERFTLRALQDFYEAILGRPLDKPAFRRRMLDTGKLVATGERETGTSFCPAELFRHSTTQE